MGEPSLLDGVDAGPVNLQTDVVAAPGIGDTANDNYANRINVAAIDKDAGPRKGKVLEHPDHPGVRWKLDRLKADNGATVEWIVVKLPPP